MENCYSIKESELFSKILNSIKRNDHDILDFLVQVITSDRDLKDLLDREIEIEDLPREPPGGPPPDDEDPEEPEEPEDPEEPPDPIEPLNP